MLKWNLLVEIAQTVDVVLMTSDSNHGAVSQRWLEVYHEDDYVELTLELTRWYDTCDEILFVNVTIRDLVIWDDENNNIATQQEYALIAELLELNRLVESSYIYK